VDEELIKAGSDVKYTVNTKGWKQVIKPHLEAKLKDYWRAFLAAKTYEEFVRAQRGYGTVYELLGSIEQTITEGEEESDKSKEHPSQ